MALSEVAAGDDPEGDLEKLAAAMAGARTDSMGRGVVVYLSLIHISEPTRPY